MPAPAFSFSEAITGGMSGLGRFAATVDKTTADEATGLKDARKAYEDTVGRENAIEDDVVKKAKEPGGGLSPPEIKPYKPPAPTEPVAIWGSSAMWIAALGGLLTRQPLTNALNAAGAVMSAFRQRDTAAAEQAYDQWKTETDNAMKMFQFAHEALDETLSLIDKTKKEAFTEYQVVAQTLQDTAAMQMKDFEMAARFQEVRQTHADRMAAAAGGVSTRAEDGLLRLKTLDAMTALQAARQSGDQTKIKAATQTYQNALEQFQAFHGKANATNTKQAEFAPLYKTAENEIDRAMDMVRKTPTVVGAPGYLRRAEEGVTGWFGNKTAPAQAFESQLTAVKGAVRNLMLKNHYMSAGAREQVDDLVKGLGVEDTPESTRESLAQIKDILNEQQGLPDEGSGGSSDDDLSTLSNDEILQQLQGP